MKHNYLKLLSLSLVLFSLSISQDKVNLEVVNKIIDLSYKQSKVMDIAWEITDGNGPRLTNSKGL